MFNETANYLYENRQKFNDAYANFINTLIFVEINRFMAY